MSEPEERPFTFYPADPGIGQLERNLSTVTFELMHMKISGDFRNDQEIMERYGFKDTDDFWATALNSPMQLDQFRFLLEVHLMTYESAVAEERARYPFLKEKVLASFREAEANGEPWFLPAGAQVPLESKRLRPRAAAEWLLSQPLHRDRVPRSLKDYIERAARPVQDTMPEHNTLVAPLTPPVPAPASRSGPAPMLRATAHQGARAPGRPSTKRTRIEADMRAMDPVALRGMTEKDMEFKFDAARSTCRDARRAVLAEIAG